MSMGIVHCKFLPQGQTINQHVYKEILRRLLRSVREKRREFWQDKSWLLHHDNAPAHNKNTAVLEHPSYSPHLAPWDFFLFPKFKGVIKGTRFEDVNNIKMAVTTELRLGKCLRLQGDYFEGENW
uniref:Tc1-like transposase DDE domain-containing protein n=1 Tax=Stegastes partitus TaxID=144197 RepID=A0A3B5A2P4_9TELE